MKITENVQRTLAKLSGAGDAAAGRFMRTQKAISGAVGGMGQRIRTGIGNAWTGVSNQFSSFKSNMLSSLPIPPQMAGALGALAGPLGVAIGLAAALTAGLVKGVHAAEQFGVGFRELRNLNMDKSPEEIQQLNDSLLGLSFDKGLDARAVSKAFYDIQSATGLYGEQVLDMTGRIGEASRALNMDYSNAVNAVSKSMLAFKMAASDVDAIIASNAKTVQVGVTTFDELARSQTVYAGAASSVGQSLDSANKVFAALTQSTKDSVMAATMTKGAFQDLAKGNTVAGLRKIGVEVFDATGAMRQADDILRDLVPQLAQMSDQTFSALKEEIGGSEGLRGLLDQAKSSGDNLIRTLDAYDASQFDLNKAIGMANEDLDVMRDKLGNQINAKFIELGQLAMPLVVKLMQGFSWILDKVLHIGQSIGAAASWMRELYDESWMVRSSVQSLFAMVEAGWAILKSAIMAVLETMMTPVRVLAKAMQGEFGEAWDELVGGADRFTGHLVDGAKGVATAFGDALEETFNPTRQVSVEPVVGDMQTGPLAAAGGPEVAGAGGPRNDPFAALFKGKGEGDAAKQGVSQVVGGGQQVRNVTVNIQSLVRELTIQTTTLREGAAEMKREVEQAIIQAVNGAELAAANN